MLLSRLLVASCQAPDTVRRACGRKAGSIENRADGLPLGLLFDSIHSRTSDMALASRSPCQADVLPVVTRGPLSHALHMLAIFISLGLPELEIFPLLLFLAMEKGTHRRPWCPRRQAHKLAGCAYMELVAPGVQNPNTGSYGARWSTTWGTASWAAFAEPLWTHYLRATSQRRCQGLGQCTQPRALVSLGCLSREEIPKNQRTALWWVLCSHFLF